MADLNEKFCTYCGQKVEGNATFCPSCGAVLNGNEAGPGPAPQQNSYSAPPVNPQGEQYKTRLMIWSIVVALTAVLFLYFAISYLTAVDSTINTMKADSSWAEWVKSSGMSEDELVNTVKVVVSALGYIFLVAGVFGAIAAVCGFTKKMYTLMLIMYVLMTVLTFWTVIGLIIGIIATIRITSTKPCFT